jgi:hypothetical protein
MATYFRKDGWVKSVLGPAIPGSQIYVCSPQPANFSSLPPSPLADIFSDSMGLVPIVQPIITDGFGHYDYYAVAGLYTEVIALNNTVQQVYPDQTIGAIGTANPPGNDTSYTAGSGISIVGSVISSTVNGVIAGGTTGQVLTKVSNTDYDVSWQAVPGLALQTNSVANTDQALLNLKNGTNITISSDGVGGVTISQTASSIRSIQVPLTASQLKNLTTTPVELIPAPGAGFMIVPFFVVANYVYGGTAFGATGEVEIIFAGLAGKWPQAIFPASGFLTAVSSQVAVSTLYGPSTTIPAAGIFAVSTVANKALQASNSAGAINTGNGSLNLTIYYQIVAVS